LQNHTNSFFPEENHHHYHQGTSGDYSLALRLQLEEDSAAGYVRDNWGENSGIQNRQSGENESGDQESNLDSDLESRSDGENNVSQKEKLLDLGELFGLSGQRVSRRHLRDLGRSNVDIFGGCTLSRGIQKWRSQTIQSQNKEQNKQAKIDKKEGKVTEKIAAKPLPEFTPQQQVIFDELPKSVQKAVLTERRQDRRDHVMAKRILLWSKKEIGKWRANTSYPAEDRVKVKAADNDGEPKSLPSEDLLIFVRHWRLNFSGTTVGDRYAAFEIQNMMVKWRSAEEKKKARDATANPDGRASVYLTLENQACELIIREVVRGTREKVGLEILKAQVAEARRVSAASEERIFVGHRCAVILQVRKKL
jgi:hypothetical protein